MKRKGAFFFLDGEAGWPGQPGIVFLSLILFKSTPTNTPPQGTRNAHTSLRTRNTSTKGNMDGPHGSVWMGTRIPKWTDTHKYAGMRYGWEDTNTRACFLRFYLEPSTFFFFIFYWELMMAFGRGTYNWWLHCHVHLNDLIRRSRLGVRRRMAASLSTQIATQSLYYLYFFSLPLSSPRWRRLFIGPDPRSGQATLSGVFDIALNMILLCVLPP